jgi:hypothetical protein
MEEERCYLNVNMFLQQNVYHTGFLLSKECDLNLFSSFTQTHVTDVDNSVDSFASSFIIAFQNIACGDSSSPCDICDGSKEQG